MRSPKGRTSWSHPTHARTRSWTLRTGIMATGSILAGGAAGAPAGVHTMRRSRNTRRGPSSSTCSIPEPKSSSGADRELPGSRMTSRSTSRNSGRRSPQSSRNSRRRGGALEQNSGRRRSAACSAARRLPRSRRTRAGQSGSCWGTRRCACRNRGCAGRAASTRARAEGHRNQSGRLQLSLRMGRGRIDPRHAAAATNQPEGRLRLPGCAWPESDARRPSFEFCENGAKAVAHESDHRRVTAEFFASHSVAELSRQSDYWLEQQGRLTEPMVLRAGSTHYEPISWDEAFALIARELKALSSPNEAIFYTSGKATNEAAFAYQLFVRQFGTNNLPDCSNMCHEASGTALTHVLGFGNGTVKLDDF